MMMDDRRGKSLFIIITGAILTIIAVFTVVGDKGLIDVLRLKEEKARIAAKKQALVAENERLRREARLLKESKPYIEEVARRELGMIGKDEVLYLIDPLNP